MKTNLYADKGDIKSLNAFNSLQKARIIELDINRLNNITLSNVPNTIRYKLTIDNNDYNQVFDANGNLMTIPEEKPTQPQPGDTVHNIDPNNTREEQINKAVKEAHISVPEEWCLNTKLDKTNAEKDFSTFLENYNNLPEVVICANDSIAIGVYNACEKFDLKIPDDIAVSGFGHVKISSLLNPPLTTVKLNLKKATEKALENLLLLINNKPITENTLIEGKIIFRESTEKK